MFKHIVMWELMEKAGGKTKEENARELKKRLEELPGLIPEIKQYEIGINAGQSSAAMDVVLISGFNSAQEFNTYRQHPAHQKVVEFINGIRSMARVVDYEAGAD